MIQLVTYQIPHLRPTRVIEWGRLVRALAAAVARVPDLGGVVGHDALLEVGRVVGRRRLVGVVGGGRDQALEGGRLVGGLRGDEELVRVVGARRWLLLFVGPRVRLVVSDVGARVGNVRGARHQEAARRRALRKRVAGAPARSAARRSGLAGRLLIIVEARR